jgi:hypothetical protein
MHKKFINRSKWNSLKCEYHNSWSVNCDCKFQKKTQLDISVYLNMSSWHHFVTTSLPAVLSVLNLRHLMGPKHAQNQSYIILQFFYVQIYSSNIFKIHQLHQISSINHTNLYFKLHKYLFTLYESIWIFLKQFMFKTMNKLEVLFSNEWTAMYVTYVRQIGQDV